MAIKDTFSMDDLNKIMDDLGKISPQKPFGRMFDKPMHFGGFPIFESSTPQKVKLSDHVQVTDEFRKDFDKWLAGFFGHQAHMMDRGQVIVTNYGIHVRKDDMAMLKMATLA